MLKELYHQDFQLWLTRTAECLRTQRYDHLDLENLIEEIESMGRSDKTALRSNLGVLLVHLLKWAYQPDKRTNGWRATIAEHALRINESFSESPSLKSYFAEVFPECYANARRLAIGNFPKQCPFAISEVLNPLPSAED